MASVRHLYNNAEEIIFEIVDKNESLRDDIQRYYYAAVLIQRVWRGYRVRRGLHILHMAATVIQKWVRRYLAFLHLPYVMLEYIKGLEDRYFNLMATKIQAWWRGLWYRKHVLNLRRMFDMRKQFMNKDSELMRRMEQERLELERQHWLQMESEAKEVVSAIVSKLHYVVRTRAVKGIYSLKTEKFGYSCVEKLLRSVSFVAEMKAVRKKYNEKYNQPKDRPFVFDGKFARCEKFYYERDRSRDLRQPKKRTVFTQKPFNLSAHLETVQQPTSIMCGKYQQPIRKLVRQREISKEICTTDFDVTKKMVKPVPKVPPYYINIYSDSCQIHNIPEI